MNQRMRYLLLFASVLLFSNLFAKETPGCWECAEEQFLKGELKKAALSYEKLVFLNNEDSLKAKALFGKLNCLERMHELEQVERCFNRLENLSLSDEIEQEIQLRKSFYYISIEKLDLAEFILENINEVELKNESHRRYWLAQYEIALKREDQELALSVYSSHLQVVNPNEYHLKKLSKKHLFKSPKTAKTLSTFVPGSGQLYACRPDHMIYSLAFIGASTIYTVGSFITGYYVTGVLTGIPVTLKFYLGGRQNAAELVNRKNEGIKGRLTLKK